MGTAAGGDRVVLAAGLLEPGAVRGQGAARLLDAGPLPGDGEGELLLRPGGLLGRGVEGGQLPLALLGAGRSGGRGGDGPGRGGDSGAGRLDGVLPGLLAQVLELLAGDGVVAAGAGLLDRKSVV